jgi:hypothetical protein
MVNDQNIQVYGWDRPLDVDFDFDLPMLAEELSRAAPFDSGALRGDLRDSVSMEPGQDAIINIEIKPPALSWRYAAIQQWGGRIPPFDIRAAARGLYMRRTYKRVMRAFIGGAVRFFTRRRGFTLRGQHYLERGIANWLTRLTGEKWVMWSNEQVATAGRSDSAYAQSIQWRSGIAGETFGGIHGTLSE